MKRQPQKKVMNVALKVACVQTRETQRKLAGEMQIPEARFSDIVRGKGVPPSDEERAVIVTVLNRYDDVTVTVDSLWPSTEQAIAS